MIEQWKACLDADDDCARSFQCVQQQGQDTEERRLAGYVGCSDVAAAGTAHVLATEEAHEQIAEGDGAQEVRCGGDE